MASQKPPFVPFDIRSAVRVYRRNLPHWRQVGATYFVTFHLQDSMPKEAIQRLERRKATWLASHGISMDIAGKDYGNRLSPSETLEFRAFVNRLREGIADAGYGSCVLKETEIRRVIRMEILREDEGYWYTGDFVIMPNHVHLLLTPITMELEECLKRIKARSAQVCNRLLGRTGALWQADSFDHIVRTAEHLQKYRKYISENPIKAGVTLSPEAYYSAPTP